MCRYLKGSPRFKYVYHWQATDDVKLRLLTDSDWANEARSRMSHSGGALLAGGHLLQHWCRRQPVVALSSGEAEVYSAVYGLSRLIGVSNVLKEMRSECWGEPMDHAVDASTCKSILLRRGQGGMKHLCRCVTLGVYLSARKQLKRQCGSHLALTKQRLSRKHGAAWFRAPLIMMQGLHVVPK